jgi:hypothetical protein
VNIMTERTWEILGNLAMIPSLGGIGLFRGKLITLCGRLTQISIDQGIKFCSKIQSAWNRFKPDESIGLVIANPMQLVSSQTDVRSERYCNLFIKSNKQKKKNDADCTVRTG